MTEIPVTAPTLEPMPNLIAQIHCEMHLAMWADVYDGVLLGDDTTEN